MSETANFLFDVGAQTERTRLAWARMALAFLTGAAMLFRAVPGAPDPAFAAVPAAGCLAAGIGLMVLSSRRYGHHQRELHRQQTRPETSVGLPDGLFLGLASVACVFGGVVAVGAVILI